MTTAQDRAAIRFGHGLPGAVPVEQMLTLLAGPDHAAARWPGPTLDQVWMVNDTFRGARATDPEAAMQALSVATNDMALLGARAILARAVGSPDSLRERLVAFWVDHFTTIPRNRLMAAAPSILADAAIRPHVTGRFADMLRAVITHPAMLAALDQDASFGPNSRKGQRGKRGLNENLARELLELHTLGVGASYGQTDVRELAELLTGLSIVPGEGFVFDAARAEPGSETVLGVTYGAEGLEPVLQALDDLAARPETSAHLSRKLVVHFVADDPDPDLVEAVATRWRDTDGDLLAVTRALVTHPAALAHPAGKVRQPVDFLIAALRSLGVDPDHLYRLETKHLRRFVLNPMAAMGQRFQRPRGPDGWPEDAAHWITPQLLAARIDWAMTMPAQLVRPLPDPRDFLQAALGAEGGERLAWAVSAAETTRDGIGLVLASPEFNRR